MQVNNIINICITTYTSIRIKVSDGPTCVCCCMLPVLFWKSCPSRCCSHFYFPFLFLFHQPYLFMCFTCVFLLRVFQPDPLRVPCLIVFVSLYFSFLLLCPACLLCDWFYFSFLAAPCLLGWLNLLAIWRVTSCFQLALKILHFGFCTSLLDLLHPASHSPAFTSS